MKTKRTKKSAGARESTRRHLREAEVGVAAAAVSGAAAGAMAGPPGAVAGAIIGGVIGTLASSAHERAAVEATELNRRLDAELGISEGDIGAPNLEHPPAKVGAYSAAASGVGSSAGSTQAEGPILPPPD